MRPLRMAIWLGALAAWAAGGDARAAWNNVFQVCCHGCKPQTSASYYPDPLPVSSPPAASSPQQNCTTRMVQRSYYQPVVSYESQTQWEQVTSYSTSYYQEPVISYRVSCYYDPSTCSYRQQSTPVTSYRWRSQYCPVQNWVSRCVSVPVTKQQLVTYYEPQTTCCTTTIGAPVPAVPGGYPTAPASPAGPSGGQPGVGEFRSQPGVGDSRENGGTSRLKPIDISTPPSGYRQPFAPGAAAPAAPAKVRLDKIVALPKPNVEGEIVRPDETGAAHARLMFRRVDRPEESESVKADSRGRFRATLASGTWEVCTPGVDGRPVSRDRIEVRENETRQVRLTSR